MALDLPPDEKSINRIVSAIRELIQGRSNAVGRVTLRANFATTVVTAVNCGKDSEIMLSPRTASAATEIGNGTVYISAVNQGSFTITHANSAVADRTFGWESRG